VNRVEAFATGVIFGAGLGALVAFVICNREVEMRSCHELSDLRSELPVQAARS
jgi:hypothetical protein